MPFIGRKKPPIASYPFAPSAARVLELSVFSIGSFIQTSRSRWALRERCLLFWNQNCTWRGVTPAGETLARLRVALSDGRRGIAGIHSRAQSPELCRGSASMLAPMRRTVMAQLAIAVSIPTRAHLSGHPTQQQAAVGSLSTGTGLRDIPTRAYSSPSWKWTSDGSRQRRRPRPSPSAWARSPEEYIAALLS